MDPYVAASASSVVFTFTASISLHVPVMSCCRSRRTHHDPRPWNHRRGFRVSVRSDLWNKQPYLFGLFKPHFHHDISLPQPDAKDRFLGRSTSFPGSFQACEKAGTVGNLEAIHHSCSVMCESEEVYLHFHQT